MVRRTLAQNKAANTDRKAERGKIGTLRDNKIGAGTLKRYETTVDNFF